MNTPVFTNKMNKFYTKALFFETSMDKDVVVYTLKDQDHTIYGKTYPSLYRLYMETGDPTEWEFAQQHLGGWTHWEEISGAMWFQPYLQRWRKELSLKLRSDALKRILHTSQAGTKESYQAQKLILQGGWVEEQKNQKGRPSKDEIKRAAAEIADAEDRVSEDFDRIMGRLN